MKNQVPLLSFAARLLIILICSGCSTSSNQLAFQQDRQLYVIEEETAAVSVYTPEGQLLQTIGTPAAGTDITGDLLVPQTSNRGLIQSIMHLLLFERGTINGIVWNDVNGNQNVDVGEPGVANVTVYLDNDNSGTLSAGDATTLTGPDGSYTIARVRAGARSVAIDLSSVPAGFGITTAPYPFTVILAQNQLATGVDFGIQDQSGEIRGTVWDQTDNVPMPGVLVYLDQNSDSEPTIGEPQDTTDSSGNYLITNLPPGTYRHNIDDTTIDIRYYQPPGAGTSPTDVVLLPGGSMTINLSYVHNATISGIARDAGGNPLAFIRVFLDLNGNGIYDLGEPVTVTDQFGNFTFTNLPPGTYTVLIQMPNGYTILASPGPLNMAAGETYAAADFITLAQPATITGSVWDDANGNGSREVTENGLVGVTVFLDDNNNGALDGGELATTTDAAGDYSFSGLGEGNYFVHAEDSTLLNAYIPTTKPNPLNRTLSPGQTFAGADFGYQSRLAPVHSLRYPARLAWGSDGRLYVSDNTNGSVFIYDSSLNLEGELKKLARPLGITTDGAGNIYVGNQGRNNVEVYDPSGNLLRTIGDGFITDPNDLAFDRAGNIYILDSSKDSILVYDQNGTLTGAIGDSLQFDYAVSIAINYRDDGSGGEVGELYVADQPNCTIHIFDLAGTFKRSAGACGSLYTTNWDGKFAGLVAVDFDQYGYIHGLDNSLNVVQVFDPQSGAFVRSYNAYPVNSGNQLNLQSDIGINPFDNRVVISNVAAMNVELITVLPVP